MALKLAMMGCGCTLGTYYLRANPALGGGHQDSFYTIVRLLYDLEDSLGIPALLELCSRAPACCLLSLWDEVVRIIRDVQAGHMAADAESPYAQLMIRVVPLIDSYLACCSLGSTALEEYVYSDTLSMMDQVPLAGRSTGFRDYRASLVAGWKQAVLFRAASIESQGGSDMWPVMVLGYSMALPGHVKELVQSVLDTGFHHSVGSQLGQASSAQALLEGPLDLLCYVAPSACTAARQMAEAFNMQEGTGILALGAMMPVSFHTAIRQAVADLRRGMDAVQICQGATEFVSQPRLGVLLDGSRRVLRLAAGVPRELDPTYSSLTFAGTDVA